MFGLGFGFFFNDFKRNEETGWKETVFNFLQSSVGTHRPVLVNLRSPPADSWSR